MHKSEAASVLSTTNLADGFPCDSDMQQLLSLLHEEIGLPRYRVISLDMAINLDLGCSWGRLAI